MKVIKKVRKLFLTVKYMYLDGFGIFFEDFCPLQLF